MEDEKKYGPDGIVKLQQADKDSREKGMTLKEWYDGLQELEKEIIQKLNDLDISFKKGEIDEETHNAKSEELYRAIGEIDESYNRLKQAYNSHLRIRTTN